MDDVRGKVYDVFISYAHKDVQDPVTGADDPVKMALVEKIKSAIEEALREGGSKHPFAFLDSEALQWGMEWNARICECIGRCRVFVYLLSPNYLRSDYCQRERLWWAQTELHRGRLHKGTRPVYYISLPETDDPVADQYIEELMVCQTDDKPFFQSLEQVRQDIVEDRLARLKEGIKDLMRSEKAAEQSFNTIFPPVSKYFVGRLKELADLNQLCCEVGRIPVLSGPAGVGKSELAAAYAYAYAEKFPRGRFLIPMQGVTDWTAALDRMVEGIKLCLHGRSLEAWGLPENFEKHPPEVRRRTAWDWLCRRAEKGRLLLLLDNLEELPLLSESTLLELSSQQGIPGNLKIIATTRLDENSASSRSAFQLFEVGALKDGDALELFCQIGDNVFPFARWPMENGRPVIDGMTSELPEDLKKAEKEYAALRKIIGLLGGHAWSLEIVAGFMAQNYGRCSFREKWESLNKDPLAEIRGRTLRNGKDVQHPELLLRSTFDRLLKYDEIDENFGENVLHLAAVASFFPPDQVPGEALAGIWKQKFGEKTLTWDDGMQRSSSCTLALELLRKYRIVNGEGPLLKMHRLTRGVLQARLAEDEKLAIIETMQKYLYAFLSNAPNAASIQLQPWLGWALEWLERLPPLQKDKLFLMTVTLLSARNMENDLYDGLEILLEQILKNALEMNCDELTIMTTNLLAVLHYTGDRYTEAEAECAEALKIGRKLTEEAPEKYNSDVVHTLFANATVWTLIMRAGAHCVLHRFSEAEAEHVEALKIGRKLAEEAPEKYGSDVVMALVALAGFHRMNNRYTEAEAECAEALKIGLKLAEEAPEKYGSSVAMSLSELANLYSDLNRHAEAEAKYAEALELYRKLAEKAPEKYSFSVATTLAELADLYRDLNRYAEAEAQYSEALELYRELAEKAPEKYDSLVAGCLVNLANLHSDLNRYTEAEAQYAEALELYRELAEKAPEKYDSSVAGCLVNLANLHKTINRFAEAETEYDEALKLSRMLAEKAPVRYNPLLATVLNCIANLHYGLGRFVEAETEHFEALNVRRRMAETAPEKYNSAVAETLNNLAGLHLELKRLKEADAEYAEALKIRRALAETAPEKYNSAVAETLNNLAVQHSNLGRMDAAESEYTEALKIRRALAETAPEKYNSAVAETLNNLAGLHSDLGRMDTAESEYTEALKIRRQLAGKTPEQYDSAVAMTLNNLAVLHKELGRMNAAESEYAEALTLYRKLAEMTHGQYDFAVAMVLGNLAILHRKLNRLSEAESESAEARRIAERYPDHPICRKILGQK